MSKQIILIEKIGYRSTVCGNGADYEHQEEGDDAFNDSTDHVVHWEQFQKKLHDRHQTTMIKSHLPKVILLIELLCITEPTISMCKYIINLE